MTKSYKRESWHKRNQQYQPVAKPEGDWLWTAADDHSDELGDYGPIRGSLLCSLFLSCSQRHRAHPALLGPDIIQASLLACSQREIMNYAIKQLWSGDVDAARELIRVFGEVFDDAESRRYPTPRDEYLRSILTNSRFIVLVALREERVIGGLTAHILDRFGQELREIYIYDLAVQAEHRRKRVATNLLSNLRQIAVSLGINTTYVQSDISDDAAVALYEKFGTKRDVFHFDILL
jgi:aminoglycoside 3-N-acetyltransferase I